MKHAQLYAAHGKGSGGWNGGNGSGGGNGGVGFGKGGWLNGDGKIKSCPNWGWALALPLEEDEVCVQAVNLWIEAAKASAKEIA